jgi:EmrB/QacA subfamily drug resistance transporter
MAATVTTTRARFAQAIAAGYGEKQRRTATIVVALAFLMDLADSTILNVALPTIQHHLHASNTEVHWMAGAYTLAFAVLLLVGGRMGDAFGYKKLFLIGVAGFMLSSLMVGLAWDPGSLITARFVQGGAAAMMVPQVLSVVQLLYKPEERVRVNGMLGGLSVLATAIAPVVAGLLIKADIGGSSWRPIFLINVPACIAALVLAGRYLPGGRSEHPVAIDTVGTVLAAAGIGLLTFPSIQSQDLGSSPGLIAMMCCALPVFGIFAWWQARKARTGESPLVLPSLFRNRSFSVGLVITLLLYASMLCFGLTFTLVLQIGHSFSAIHAVLTGMIILAGALPTATLLTKRVIPSLGRWSLTIGAVMLAAGTVGAAIIIHHAGADLTWDVAPALVVMGVGMSMVASPLMPYVLSGVDPRDAGSASGTANAVQQTGGALGIALIGAVFYSQLTTTVSYNHAFEDAAWVQVILLAICAMLTLLLPRRIAPMAPAGEADVTQNASLEA